MQLNQDWHIHTCRSNCGKPENTVPAIVAALAGAGMAAAGLSDHIDLPEQRSWFEDVVEASRRDLADTDSQCRIVVGTEATMLSPTACALPGDLADRLDFVLVACNHYHLEAVENPSARTAESYAAHYLDMVAGAAELGFADAVSHPFLHSKLEPDLAHECLRRYDERQLEQTLRLAASAGLAFELNPYAVRHALEWFRDLVREGRRLGVSFTLGSDSHTLEHLGYRPDGETVDPQCVVEAIGLHDDDLKWPPDRPHANY